MKFKRYIKESIDDMDKRCPECNTLLNDGGTCPKCDDGEEDYGDEVNEALTNSEKLKRAFPELNFDDPIHEEIKCEALSNLEKLKRAYPELNFEDAIQEEIQCEDLTNIEKLKRAYPELNLDETTVVEQCLTEDTGADILSTVKNAMEIVAKDSPKNWAKTVVEIVSIIPPNFADELFEAIKKTFANSRLDGNSKNEVSSSLGLEIDETKDTVGELCDYAESRTEVAKDSELIKTFVTVLLGILAVVEPTPVLEVITAVVATLPADVIAKVFEVINSLNPLVGKAMSDSASDNTEDQENSIEESVDDTTFDYDDDYDFEDDDIEQDRIHAALYGGDRTYCDCGRRLQYGEDGYTYCPDCDNDFPYDDDIK